VSTTDPAPALIDRHAVRSASSAVTAMAMFVASEAVFFGAFFGIYASGYTASKVWPPLDVPSPALLLPTAATLVLVFSGATMAVALRRTRREDYPRGSLPWLWLTTVCALAFVALVLFGLRDVGFGIGQGIYESLFYVITTLALAHVAGGVVLLSLVLLRARSGELALQREPLQAAGIYWYFVVALGVVIYLLLYLAAAG
jgi:cytochrome c oxidase subunit 3